MKKSIFISVCCFFLFGINSIAEGLETSEDFKKTQLVWDQLFDKINERLSRLESEFKEEKQKRQEFNSKINDNLSNLTKTMNERIDKVEQTGSILETNNIAKSFRDTIGVLNKNTSEMEKRLETLEVNVAVVEKIYHVSQKPLETLMKAIDEQKIVIVQMDKKLEKLEEIILAMRESSKKRTTANETKAEIIKESNDRIIEKKSENIADSTDQERVAPSDKDKIKMNEKAPEAVLTETKEEQPESVKEKAVEVLVAKTPNKSEDFKAIGNDFYVRDVTFSEYGSSSIMKGEIKNDSRKDLASISFSMKILGEDGSIIAETVLSIISFKSNETKSFEQLISGIHPSQISEYEIVCKKKI